MKKLAFILCFVFLFSALCLFVSADTSETVVSEAGNNATSASTDFSTWQIAIVSCIMFTVIALIGVMFIKVVIKNNKRY